MSELAKAYLPAQVERQWYQRWIEARCFHGDEKSAKPAFSIVIPPPNVTGVLHLGHVLNNTLQDIQARRARMKGCEVCWFPGTDHAGIATQTVVERELRKEKLTRQDVGREAFLERVWNWKEKHGDIITQQLKRLGCSCDWERQRFTMDTEYSRCVQWVFVDLHRKGLIYRGRRMVNWCPKSLTALSDEEVIMKPQRSKLFTMRYELVESPGIFLKIATTRPETLMADTAVAVNPGDERYQHLIGQNVWRPFPRAAIPILGDDNIDPMFGTGVLKVTPAHDKADYEIGLRHGLPVIEVLNQDGTLNELAGAEFAGMERFEARKLAAAKLAELGLLAKEEDYENNVGFSERADVPIEPRLSEQWFLKYPCVGKARHSVEQREETGADEAGAGGKIRFYPQRWAKVYDHWMENIQDWCISRQLWWGHRIPVWKKRVHLTEENWANELLPWGWDSYLEGVWASDAFVRIFRTRGGAEIDPKVDNLMPIDSSTSGEFDVFVSTCDEAKGKNLESHGFIQDPDVLDTWCSSWLWPFAVMGWTGDPESDAQNETLRKFYPTSDLVTGPDIIFFWVARMIMAGLEYTREAPFRNVYFTGIIRDKQGRKMTKSLGNSPDPLDLIDKYGADGLRFGLLRIAPSGTDVRFDEKQIEEGRNFANKLWNACRYRLMQGPREGPAPEVSKNLAGLGIYALDILAKLDTLEAALESAFTNYEFNHAANLLYDFFWAGYCDLFLETIKGDLSAAALAVQDVVLERFLIRLHPFMPHITEELWATLGFGRPATFLMQTSIPTAPVLGGIAAEKVAQAQERAAAVYAAAARIRNLKAEYNVAARRDVTFILKPATAWACGETRVLALLSGAASVSIESNYSPSKESAAAITDLGEFFLPLEGLIDVAAERIRLQKERDKLAGEVQKDTAKLESPAFAQRAPAEVVMEIRQRLAEKNEKAARLAEMLKNLG
ncbi:MAG: valine--tRNA ligase [Verrucomicrobiales bacterium]